MSLPRNTSKVVFLALALLVRAAAQNASPVSREEARTMIQQGNAAWAKARVALDRATFEKMLAPAPEFYVQLSDGRRLTREQFLERITAYPPGVNLLRFDATVLTVEPQGDHWVAVILEKLEVERKTK